MNLSQLLHWDCKVCFFSGSSSTFASTFIACFLLQRSSFHKGQILAYIRSWRSVEHRNSAERERDRRGCEPMKNTFSEIDQTKIIQHFLKLQWQNQYQELSENHSVLICLDLRGSAQTISRLIRGLKMYTIILVWEE